MNSKLRIPLCWKGTESPRNAIRQISPLLHYVQDTGAPNHCGPSRQVSDAVTLFSNREMFPGGVNRIHIPGYRPRLLGRTDDEAERGLRQRMDDLWAQANRDYQKGAALPAFPDEVSPEIDALILELSLESARASADLLYTLFSLTLPEQAVAEGGRIDGTITGAAVAGYERVGARVILLEAKAYDALSSAARQKGDFAGCMTDYATEALASTDQPAKTAWRGEWLWHHLPAGTYRVLGIRLGAQWLVSEPIALHAGGVAKVDLLLPATEPPGNVLLNPTGALSYLAEGFPDRWMSTGTGLGFKATSKAWRSHTINLTKGLTYHLGAVLKDPTARVRYYVHETGEVIELPAGAQPPETKFSAKKDCRVTASVDSVKPLPEVLERIWVAPEFRPRQ